MKKPASDAEITVLTVTPSQSQEGSSRQLSSRPSLSSREKERRKSASRHRSRSKSRPTSRRTRGADDSSAKQKTITARDGKDQIAADSKPRPPLKRDNFTSNRSEPVKVVSTRGHSRPGSSPHRRSDKDGRRSDNLSRNSSSRRRSGSTGKQSADRRQENKSGRDRNERRSERDLERKSGADLAEKKSADGLQNRKGSRTLDRRPIDAPGKNSETVPTRKFSEVPDKKLVDFPTKKFSEIQETKAGTTSGRKFVEVSDRQSSGLLVTPSSDPKVASGGVTGSETGGIGADLRSSRIKMEFRRPVSRETSSERLQPEGRFFFIQFLKELFWYLNSYKNTKIHMHEIGALQ